LPPSTLVAVPPVLVEPPVPPPLPPLPAEPELPPVALLPPVLLLPPLPPPSSVLPPVPPSFPDLVSLEQAATDHAPSATSPAKQALRPNFIEVLLVLLPKKKIDSQRALRTEPGIPCPVWLAHDGPGG